MVFYIIGIGLADEKDITLKGLEAVKKCREVFLESYTSKLQCSVSDLENFYNKKIKIADRELVEKKADEILKDNNCLLIIGDPMSATTHIDLYNRAKEKGLVVEVIHNASILTAVGIVGLELYKYGKTTSIPFHNENVKTPIDVIKMNLKNGLHTLVLLDLDPINNKFMTIGEAAEYLLKNKVKEINEETIAIGCAAIGSKKQIIKAGKLSELKKFEVKEFPQCIIIPGKLHFVEEEMIEKWR
ncbi:MAG: diphthine synthase [Nanoarchaeota archaeon]|nr:diphthine synthase [Nanoarchaeota archaeon]